MTDGVNPTRPFNVYLDFEQAGWLDSMEGVPPYEPTRPAELLGEKLLTFAWQKWLHRLFDWLGAMAPGVVLAVALAFAGSAMAGWLGTWVLGFERSPLSPILMTVLLGLIVRNVAGLPAAYEKGLRLCVKRILRIGVALLGLRLSIVAVGQIGLSALPVVVGCVSAALIVVTWLSRLVGLSPRLGCLIAVGTSICGVSAIVATGPAIDAEEDEVSYAVAVITLFGMMALFTYPFLAHWLFRGDPQAVGFFLGTAIHDTSQVAGAALMYQLYYDAPEALNVAATTKLVRNVCMGAVIPLMAILHHRRSSAGPTSGTKQIHWLKWSQWVPLFVIGFAAMAAVRSIGDLGPRAFGMLDRGLWDELLAGAKTASVLCLNIAMAAVGLGTSFTQLKKLGWKPLCMGLTAALLVGCVSWMLVVVMSTVN